MAENKQYITQPEEHGTVLISEEVIAGIVSLAVAEVEGLPESAPSPARTLWK